MKKDFNYKCVNCKNEIPLPKKEIYKINKQILPKFCINCKIESPRQSMKSRKPGKK